MEEVGVVSTQRSQQLADDRGPILSQCAPQGCYRFLVRELIPGRDLHRDREHSQRALLCARRLVERFNAGLTFREIVRRKTATAALHERPLMRSARVLADLTDRAVVIGEVRNARDHARELHPC
jgi:hypothetical protein